MSPWPINRRYVIQHIQVVFGISKKAVQLKDGLFHKRILHMIIVYMIIQNVTFFAALHMNIIVLDKICLFPIFIAKKSIIK